MKTRAPSRGFLPEADPATELPPGYGIWDELGEELPHLLACGKARTTLAKLAPIGTDELAEPAHQERAFGLLSVLGHAAVHESWRTASASSVPKGIAIPWVSLARKMQRLPVLAYASHGLNNWRRLDPRGAVALGNIAVLRTFFGGLDEHWFVATHVDIEASAAPLIRAAMDAQEAVACGDAALLQTSLSTMALTLYKMGETLERVRENCDPHIFFNRVQPFMQGMRGVIYDGVPELNGMPQNHPGGSGAQSSVLPIVDAVLGVRHAPDALLSYLTELRRYMPAEHRELLVNVEHRGAVNLYASSAGDAALLDTYNQCIDALGSFRDKHLQISIDFIQRPAKQQASNRGEHGTGGSPFVGYLEKHRKETFINILK
jgi:indoleamine 2,3-dioxygenase